MGKLPASVALSWFYVDVALIGGFFFRYNAVILGNLLVFAYLLRCSKHARKLRPLRVAVPVPVIRRYNRALSAKITGRFRRSVGSR
jgi:hypothetical protein